MKEINFENLTPDTIQSIESGMKRMGCRAHTGTSGTVYADGQEVTIGLVFDRPKAGYSVPGVIGAWHTDKSGAQYWRDGVPVNIAEKEWLKEENEESYE